MEKHLKNMYFVQLAIIITYNLWSVAAFDTFITPNLPMTIMSSEGREDHGKLRSREVINKEKLWSYICTKLYT